MKVILKIDDMMLTREKCENIRDTVINDLNTLGVAVVPFFVDVYILDDKTEVLKERPHGEWIPYKTDLLTWNVCNQCRASVGTLRMNFCPNCGADMRGNNNANK